MACPFCDASVGPLLEQSRAAPRAPLQPGVKRAVLFAIGAGLTQAACSSEPDPLPQPIYGAPAPPFDGSSGGNTGTTDPGTTSAVDSDTTELAQPVYGAPVDPIDTTSVVDLDTTELAQPVYGAPVDPGDASLSTDPDAGGGDAGADAGSDASDASSDDPNANSNSTRPPWNDNDGGPLIVPLYGAIPAERQ